MLYLSPTKGEWFFDAITCEILPFCIVYFLQAESVSIQEFCHSKLLLMDAEISPQHPSYPLDLIANACP